MNAYRGIAGEGFLRAGVPQAMDLIDDVFQALAAAALRQIDLRCPHCAFVSPDEALLLGAVAASQRKQHAIAWSALCALLPPAAARGALPSLIALAVLFRDAKLVLSPARRGEMRRAGSAHRPGAGAGNGAHPLSGGGQAPVHEAAESGRISATSQAMKAATRGLSRAGLVLTA